MIVCVCNAIREDEVREAAREGRGLPAGRLSPRSAASRSAAAACAYAQEVIDDEQGDGPAQSSRVVINFPRAA